VILYVGDDWEREYPVRGRMERPLWRRRFLPRPRSDGWVIWQVHGYAHVDGVDGGVDLNLMRRDRVDAA
jgi:lysozyme